jgi:hypothetical protein
MKTEDIEKVYKVESKLAASWLELSQLISGFELEGVEVEDLKEAKAMIQKGLETIIVSLK